ncbi:hypothetical protein UACE39S_06536 [Ureibacillus acetophenoni]
MNELKKEPKISFIKKHEELLFSALLIALGYTSSILNGEDNLVSVLLFLSAIVIGGYSLFKVGIQNLFRLDFDMKTLMTVAIIGAAFIEELAEGAVVVNTSFAISEVGLDPQAIRKLIQIIEDYKNNGAAILMSTHALDTAEKICDQFVLIHNGTVLKKGTLKELQRYKDEPLLDIFDDLIEEAEHEHI